MHAKRPFLLLVLAAALTSPPAATAVDCHATFDTQRIADGEPEADPQSADAAAGHAKTHGGPPPAAGHGAHGGPSAADHVSHGPPRADGRDSHADCDCFMACDCEISCSAGPILGTVDTLLVPSVFAPYADGLSVDPPREPYLGRPLHPPQAP